MLRIYKNGWFAKFARREQISDEALCEAVRRAEQGLIDADLGGGLVKQRLARPGGGKSGGYRTIMLYRAKARAVFVYGFAKSDRANLDPDEVETYRAAARVVLALGQAQVEAEVAAGRWMEVRCDDQDL